MSTPSEAPAYSLELRDAPVTIGRSADNDLPLGDPFCSGRHAVVRKGDKRLAH